MWCVARRLVFAVVSLATASAAFAAADALTLSTVTALPGTTARVPVHIRDVSHTSLDSGSTARIQIIQFTVSFSHPELIDGCSASKRPDCGDFTPGGVLAGHTPVVADVFKGTASLSVTYSYAQSSDPLAFQLDAAAPGDLIGFLDVKLLANAASGSKIDITIDPSSDATFLADQLLGGTITESKPQGELQLVNGAININECSGTPAGLSFTVRDSSGALCGGGQVGPCKTNDTLTFTANSGVLYTLSGCDSISWNYGDGTSNATGKHVYTQASSFTVTMTDTTLGGKSVGFPGQVVVAGSGGVCPCVAAVPAAGTTTNAVNFLAIGCDNDTFTWTFGDGGSATSVSGQTITHSYGTASTFKWTADSPRGCHRDSSIMIKSPAARRRAAGH